MSGNLVIGIVIIIVGFFRSNTSASALASHTTWLQLQLHISTTLITGIYCAYQKSNDGEGP